MEIYFDYNATHPPLREILEKNQALYFRYFGNPSGISHFSQKSLAKLEQSRKSLSSSLSIHSKEMPDPDFFHFVSSGTEALYQMVYSFAGEGDTVITDHYEHPAFYAACEDRRLNIEFMEADRSGLIKGKQLEEKIKTLAAENSKISFISFIGVSNETGIIQNAEEISGIARKNNIPFISDLIQAAGKIPVDSSLYDGFALNGIKFGAGPGASAVFIRHPWRAKPIFRGGDQEDGRRAGTENILAISNLADALRHQLEHLEEKNRRLSVIQKMIETFLENDCGASIVGSGTPRVPNTTLAILPPCDMDILLIALDQEKIYISTGSSCKSRARKPASSLIAMGYSAEEALRSIRISTGINSTGEETAMFIEKFSKAFKMARK